MTITVAPVLAGALCVGRWGLFDPVEGDDDHQVVEQLHDEARATCARCPALTACSTWVDSLPPQHRPIGIVAGRLIDNQPSNPKGNR